MPIDKLKCLITEGDVAGVDTLLRSLDGTDRVTVKRWFEGSRSWFRELDPKTLLSKQRLDIHHARQWCEGICAVSLLGAVTAAGRVPWREFWSFRQWPGEDEFINQLRDSDRDWVAAFADAASRARLGGNARNTNATLARVLRAAVTHHDLPSPSGATFLREWLAGSPEGPLLDVLRRDPLMPELLYLYLASGECGRTPGLADAAVSLVDDGTVDRHRLVDVVLEQLTTQQRPASQRVLAEVLRGLDVTAAEVPGGLSYLVGVVATSQGVVGQVLLPLAVDVVGDAAGLAELASVIAGRPERKQKDVLLRALQGEELRSRIGDQPVLAALRLLGADSDVAFAAEVAKARAELGDVPESPAEPEVPLGLWERAPEVLPAAQVRPLFWWRLDLLGTWEKMLRSGPPIKDEVGIWAINATLNEIAFGTFDFAALAERAAGLLLAGKLSMSQTARLFEDLFLGGAMSQAWPVALTVADAACAAARRPAGAERLLRMLAGYAREAPRQDVPEHIEALAAGAGETKAEQEARTLGAALTREVVADYVARLSTTVGDPGAAPVRGLWLRGQHVHLPKAQRIHPTDDVDLGQLRLDAVDHLYLYHDLRGTAARGAMVRSDMLLRDVLTAVRRHGADSVRDCLEGVEQPLAPGPVGAAIDLWARHALNPQVFWKLVLDARPHHEAMAQVRADPTLTERERAHLAMNPHLVTTDLDDDVPTLPFGVHGRSARATFFRACEAMVRVERAPLLLSTPAYEDGTLDFDDLRSRLVESRAGGVGPLDFVQALYRLRPTDTGRVADLDLPPVMTDAGLTSPGGQHEWDAVDVLRTWVAKGGLPPLTSRPSADATRWTFTADPPVGWEGCEAAPSGMLDSAVIDHDWSGDVARVFPQWPDRVLRQPFTDSTGADDFTIGLLQMSGDFGLASHDYLLGALVRLDEVRRQGSVGRLAELIGQAQLDPDLAVTAAMGRYETGALALPALVHPWGEVFERGGLRGLWPLAVAIAGALCELAPKPSGLPALLRLLTTYAHEVPQPSVPDGVRVLAESRGSTRSHVEARALVAALTRGPQ